MASFKKTNAKVFAPVSSEQTPDNFYWNHYTPAVFVKEYGAIDYIDFSPAEPHHFAVTCSLRVQVYNPITKLVTKNLSKFKETAYGASFRRDGKLLCAGGEEPVVRLFDVATRSLLRMFSGHEKAVHRTYFTADGLKIASFSDDKTTALWDIPTEKRIISFDEHTEYVRSGACSPVSPDIFISGSYDKTVQMYDARMNKKLFTVNHGAPVESLLFLPSGAIFLSAGGTEIRVWDALSGGKLLAKISQHHKTITCLRIASNGRRILSGSLDSHVKIYDAGTYKTVHTLDYPNAVLSLGISADDETIVAGMVDGLISIRRREDDAKGDVTDKKKKVPYRHSKRNHHALTIDAIVPAENKQLMGKYDTCLRKFQYSKALDCVMVSYVVNKMPNVTIALMQELIRRQGLRQALAGRDGKNLVNIIKFLTRHVEHVRYGPVAIYVIEVLTDIYEDKWNELNPECRTMFELLGEKLKDDEELILLMSEYQGMLDMFQSIEEIVEPISIRESSSLEPSSAAQKNLIVSIP